jgi:hypothetical protein
MEDLYEIGFFGKLVNRMPSAGEARPVTTRGEKVYLECTFAEPALQLIERDAIAIHPIFWQRLNLQAMNTPPFNEILGPPGA